MLIEQPMLLQCYNAAKITGAPKRDKQRGRGVSCLPDSCFGKVRYWLSSPLISHKQKNLSKASEEERRRGTSPPVLSLVRFGSTPVHY